MYLSRIYILHIFGLVHNRCIGITEYMEESCSSTSSVFSVLVSSSCYVRS